MLLQIVAIKCLCLLLCGRKQLKEIKIMTIKERVDTILNRPMDRKQFLTQVGLLLLAAVGITSLLNTLESKQGKRASVQGEGPSYGASVYAGKRSV